MLGTDVAVTLALLLSLASAVLCVAYGWSHWNADDDVPPTGGPSPTADRSADASGRSTGS